MKPKTASLAVLSLLSFGLALVAPVRAQERAGYSIDPKQVDITVTNDTITLRGQTRHEDEQKGRQYYRREFRSGEFSRTLPLATEVKSAEANATYKDGVLEVTLPKSERVKPTSVKVQAE